MKKSLLKYLTLFLLLSCCVQPVNAASTGGSGTVLTGDYVMVVNTNPDPSSYASTGTLVFDNSGSMPQAYSEPDSLYDQVIEQKRVYNSPSVQSLTSYTIGDTRTFFHIDQGTAEYICIGIGTNSYVWIERNLKSSYDSNNITNTAAHDIIAAYDGKVHALLTELANNDFPDADGSDKLSILLETMTSASGYYYSGDSTVTAIHVRAPSAAGYSNGYFAERMSSLFAHEGQHALFHRVICQGNGYMTADNLWLNEGLSVTLMDYINGGGDTGGWMTTVNNNTALRNGAALLYEEYRSNTAMDYSMPYLFVRYLLTQMGHGYNPHDALLTFYDENISYTQNTIAYLEKVMNDNGLTGSDGNPLTIEEALANFYVALVAQEKTGRYGFYGDPIVAGNITDYPVYLGNSNASVNLAGSAALLLKTNNGTFTVPTNADSSIRFIAFDKTPTASLPEHGSGTLADPYQITSDRDLLGLYTAPDKHFKLMNDITMDDTYFTVENFTGVLDGDGHTINGLKTPLFEINSGTIKNLRILANYHDEIFSQYFGLFANTNNSSGTIIDCSLGGVITLTISNLRGGSFPSPMAGGMTGENYGIMERCYADASMTVNVQNTENSIGLLNGRNDYRIEDCYSRGFLTVNQNNSGNYLLNTGGISGEMYGSYFVASMVNCYSITDITVNAPSTSITKNTGRLVGYQHKNGYDANVVSSYSLSGMSAAGSTISSALSDAVASKTQSQLQTAATYTNWDFGGVWILPENEYPRFMNETDISTIRASLVETDYYLGEKLNLTNATLTINDQYNVPLLEEYLDSYDTSQVNANQTITGKYMGKSFSFVVNYRDPQSSVTALTIEHTPNKVTYVASERFNTDGLILKAIINNTAHYIYDGYTINKTTPLSLADSEIVFTYGGKTVSQAITVSPKTISGISITSSLTQTSYSVGQKMNMAGLRVQLRYNDGTSSGALPYEELSANNVRIKRRYNEVTSDFDPAITALTMNDNDADFFLYYSDDVTAYLFTPTVTQSVTLENQRIILKQGMMNYSVRTEEIVGGSGDYTAQLISGTVPSGVTVTLPTGYNNYCFEFGGTPTSLGITTLIYRITDTVTSQSIQTIIALEVIPKSDACDITSFIFMVAFNNNNLFSDAFGVISSNSIVITVPHATDITNLAVTLTCSEGASVEPWNGTSLDFTTPQIFTVTSESEAQSKVYTVTVIVAAPEAVKLNAVTNLAWNNRTISWDAVTAANGYTIELYRENDSGWITTVSTSATSYDFSSIIYNSGNYYIKITANDSTGTYLTSDETTGPVLAYQQRMKGDINGDGSITTADLILLRRHLANISQIEAGSMSFFAADINNDGYISTSDLIKMRRHLANIERI